MMTEFGKRAEAGYAILTVRVIEWLDGSDVDASR